MVINMKENTKLVHYTVKAHIHLDVQEKNVVINMKVDLNMAKNMAKVHIHMQMVKNMKVDLKMV